MFDFNVSDSIFLFDIAAFAFQKTNLEAPLLATKKHILKLLSNKQVIDNVLYTNFHPVIFKEVFVVAASFEKSWVRNQIQLSM